MKTSSRLSLLVIASMLFAAVQAHAYFDPRVGRWASRDPIGEGGGRNVYSFVANNPYFWVDRLGLIGSRAQPRNIFCQGVCGAIIDDWIVAEISAQVTGWNQYKKDNPGKTDFASYIPWSNGNQRYKDPSYFEFNNGTGCSTKDKGSAEGCGPSVTLYGKCVKSDILGNLMYGIVASAVGFSESNLNDVSGWKRSIGFSVDKYDEEAYHAGASLSGNLPAGFTAADVCKAINSLLDSGGTFLRQGRNDGAYNDLSNCRPCDQKTTVNRHGGSEPPRYRP